MKINTTPRIISWNTTFKCNLKCGHCYISAKSQKVKEELTTKEGFRLIDQISEFSKPIFVLSGGEPLLREDIFELASYGTKKGLRMGMGTNGISIDNDIAKKLLDSGIKRVAISIDSITPSIHDSIRGVNGAYEGAIKGIKACKKNNLSFQINTTVTKQNCSEIFQIVKFAQKLGADDFHLFFLVPTGRGENITDITPLQYEKLLLDIYDKKEEFEINVKPTCAPQFMRISKMKGGDTERYLRGCLAGINYCRINPTGEVNPCPYLPIYAGNIREKSFEKIWKESLIFQELRDYSNLKGKCGICEYKDICGGCRARAYAISKDYLGEESWCVYQPRG